MEWGERYLSEDVIIYMCSSAKMYLVLYIAMYLVAASPQTAPSTPTPWPRGGCCGVPRPRLWHPHAPHLSVGALSAASEHQCSRPYAISEDTCVNLAYSKSWLNRGLS